MEAEWSVGKFPFGLSIVFVLPLWFYLANIIFYWEAPPAGAGRHISELIQDAVEKNWGIRKFYKTFLSERPDDIPRVEKQPGRNRYFLVQLDPASGKKQRLGEVSSTDELRIKINFSEISPVCLQGVPEGGKLEHVYDDIAIYVDLFNYLFYAPGLTEENLVEINPKLTYRSLGDGIWLGQYADYIKAVSYLLLAYLVAFILWAVMCGISIWFLWSDIHGWLKRRKLKQVLLDEEKFEHEL